MARAPAPAPAPAPAHRGLARAFLASLRARSRQGRAVLAVLGPHRRADGTAFRLLRACARLRAVLASLAALTAPPRGGGRRGAPERGARASTRSLIMLRIYPVLLELVRFVGRSSRSSSDTILISHGNARERSVVLLSMLQRGATRAVATGRRVTTLRSVRCARCSRASRWARRSAICRRSNLRSEVVRSRARNARATCRRSLTPALTQGLGTVRELPEDCYDLVESSENLSRALRPDVSPGDGDSYG